MFALSSALRIRRSCPGTAGRSSRSSRELHSHIRLISFLTRGGLPVGGTASQGGVSVRQQLGRVQQGIQLRGVKHRDRAVVPTRGGRFARVELDLGGIVEVVRNAAAGFLSVLLVKFVYIQIDRVDVDRCRPNRVALVSRGGHLGVPDRGVPCCSRARRVVPTMRGSHLGRAVLVQFRVDGRCAVGRLL